MPAIAPLTRADHAEWLALWDGYLTFYETTLDAATTAATFDLRPLLADARRQLGGREHHAGAASGSSYVRRNVTARVHER